MLPPHSSPFEFCLPFLLFFLPNCPSLLPILSFPFHPLLSLFNFAHHHLSSPFPGFPCFFSLFSPLSSRFQLSLAFFHYSLHHLLSVSSALPPSSFPFVTFYLFPVLPCPFIFPCPPPLFNLPFAIFPFLPVFPCPPLLSIPVSPFPSLLHPFIFPHPFRLPLYFP